uniref:Abortive infection protein-like C-terminal domain-containing protein n=1 Tax=mine drainage metagenome TaxID=410659 RepID=E6QWR9_9ZZZZ
MRISEITRRDIVDELRLRNTQWNGRLDEVEFLGRLYSLDKLPSHDKRFEDMAGDIFQHRINNLDWDEWWIFEDSRLQLDDDERFLNLLCEMIHPVTRSDRVEVAALVEMFNSHLAPDGWKVIEKEKISGRPVFVAISNEAAVQVENTERIGSANALSQLKKCEERIGLIDYEGAISASRSLLESVFADIYERTTGDKVRKGGSLMDLYKVIKNLLNLSDDKYSNEAIKTILRSLAAMVEGLDNLSNDMGDRHIRPVAPQRRHAQLCVNAAKTLTTFLYDTLESKFQGKENIYQQLIGTLDSDARLLPYDELLSHRNVQKIYAQTDPNIRNVLKRTFIDEYDVDSFRDSDIFFAAMRILRNELRSSDIEAIYKTHKNNDQACGLKKFLNEIYEFKADLLSSEIKQACASR